MKIWHISDTHTFHGLLKVPDGIDMIIHSGDASNPKDPYLNKVEVENFIYWFSKLDVKYKVFVAGNHDTSIERNFIKPQHFVDVGIYYLNGNSIQIEGLNIWGSPLTPTFGEGWAFNKRRDKLHDVWKKIPDDTDIVITHGPAKGILDASYNRKGELEFCGCSALKKRMLTLNAKLHLFGHIHNCEDIINAGTMKLSAYPKIFSNGSVVTDGKFGYLTSNGNVFEL